MIPRRFSALYRYRCACGKRGRGYADGNLAIVYGERHVTDPKARVGVRHSYWIEEREEDGSWRRYF